MSNLGGFAWVKRIGKNWVLNAQALMGVTFYAALALVLLALVTPREWHFAILGGIVLVLSLVAGATERWLFFNLIKCPHCGFNATYGKATDRPLNYSLAWSRLKQYESCPRCGNDGTAS